MIEQFACTRSYDAVYFNADKTDTDPAINPDFWFSSGSAHIWNLEQKTPATEWERRIDELMARQIASPDEAERKRLFDEVQKIFAEHLPIVYFAAPRIYRRARRSRVTNLTPAVLRAAAAVGGRHARRRPLIALPRRGGWRSRLFLVIAVSSASLVLARLAPGDYVDRLARHRRRSRETIEQARARLRPRQVRSARSTVDWLGAARPARLRPLAAVRPAGRAT